MFRMGIGNKNTSLGAVAPSKNAKNETLQYVKHM